MEQDVEFHGATSRARASQQQLKADFEAYLDGFSPNVQDILDNSSYATRFLASPRPMPSER